MLKSRQQKNLYLDVFSCGLLVNNGEKNTVVLNNPRYLISHNKEMQLGSLQDSYPCGLSLLESCTTNPNKKKKIYASKRGPIDHLPGILQTRKEIHKVSTRSEIPLCKVVHKYQNARVCVHSCIPSNFLQPAHHKHDVRGRAIRSKPALLLLLVQQPLGLKAIPESPGNYLKDNLTRVDHERDTAVISALSLVVLLVEYSNNRFCALLLWDLSLAPNTR